MLEMRPSCECCAVELPPNSAKAMICTFECTFCLNCVEQELKGVCPNCGGGFCPRPIRPEVHLTEHPPSTKHVNNPEGCSRPKPELFPTPVPLQWPIPGS